MVRKNDKQKMIVVVIVLSVAAILVGASTMQAGLLTGYGGMTAEIIGLEDASNLYGAAPYNFDYRTRILGTTAQVDPDQPFLMTDVTGVRMELTSRLQPVAGAIQNLGDVERPYYEHGVEAGVEYISARIIPMVMGVTVRTYGSGAGTIRDIMFTVRIQENDMNFFEDADATMAYIIEIYLIDAITSTSPELMQLAPSSGGVIVPHDAVGVNPVPDWINYATGEIDYSIPATASVILAYLNVVNAAPTWPPMGARTENEASWNIGVDVLVFGQWVVEGEPREIEPWDFPAMWDSFLAAVGDVLATAGWVVFGVIVVMVLFVVFMIIYAMNRGRRSSRSLNTNRKSSVRNRW